jgi:hypothetical protein
MWRCEERYCCCGLKIRRSSNPVMLHDRVTPAAVAGFMFPKAAKAVLFISVTLFLASEVLMMSTMATGD